jgi:hypothetical protein
MSSFRKRTSTGMLIKDSLNKNVEHKKYDDSLKTLIKKFKQMSKEIILFYRDIIIPMIKNFIQRVNDIHMTNNVDNLLNIDQKLIMQISSIINDKKKENYILKDDNYGAVTDNSGNPIQFNYQEILDEFNELTNNKYNKYKNNRNTFSLKERFKAAKKELNILSDTNSGGTEEYSKAINDYVDAFNEKKDEFLRFFREKYNKISNPITIFLNKNYNLLQNNFVPSVLKIMQYKKIVKNQINSIMNNGQKLNSRFSFNNNLNIKISNKVKNLLDQLASNIDILAQKKSSLEFILNPPSSSNQPIANISAVPSFNSSFYTSTVNTLQSNLLKKVKQNPNSGNSSKKTLSKQGIINFLKSKEIEVGTKVSWIDENNNPKFGTIRGEESGNIAVTDNDVYVNTNNNTVISVNYHKISKSENSKASESSVSSTENSTLPITTIGQGNVEKKTQNNSITSAFNPLNANTLLSSSNVSLTESTKNLETAKKILKNKGISFNSKVTWKNRLGKNKYGIVIKNNDTDNYILTNSTHTEQNGIYRVFVKVNGSKSNKPAMIEPYKLNILEKKSNN